MESFSSVIELNLKNRPFYYSGDSDRANQRGRSEIIMAENPTGQYLFDAWGIPNPAYSEE